MLASSHSQLAASKLDFSVQTSRQSGFSMNQKYNYVVILVRADPLLYVLNIDPSQPDVVLEPSKDDRLNHLLVCKHQTKAEIGQR